MGTIRASAPFVDGPASTCLSADPGPRPSGREHRPFEWGWRAVGLCSPCLRWWGRLCRRRCAAGSCVRAVSALSWCEEVSLGGKQSLLKTLHPRHHRNGFAALAFTPGCRNRQSTRQRFRVGQCRWERFPDRGSLALFFIFRVHPSCSANLISKNL